MFSRKKAQKTQIVVASEVVAELQQISFFPDISPRQHSAGIMCKKVRVDGIPPNASFSDDAQVQTPDTGYIVTNIADHPPLVIANTSDFNFKVWNLGSESNLSFTEEVQFGKIHLDQDKWLGFYVLDVACLPLNQVLLAVAYYDPRIKYALYVYDINNTSFRHLTDAEADIQNPYQFFEYKRLSGESSLVLYYSERTRKAAELYYNAFNHFMLFTPENRNGLEILRLSIETGNVTNWVVDGRTLYIQTSDNRKPEAVIKNIWSLDLSRVLPE